MESIDAIKQRSFGEVREYVFNTLPQMYQGIDEACQKGGLTPLQVLGFCEVAFNGLLCGAGLMNNHLVIRWPKNYDILFTARENSQHDWFVLPEKQFSDQISVLYVSALKTANVVFNYLLDNVQPPVASQLLTQAIKQGLTESKKNGLAIDIKQNASAYLLTVVNSQVDK